MFACGSSHVAVRRRPYRSAVQAEELDQVFLARPGDLAALQREVRQRTGTGPQLPDGQLVEGVAGGRRGRRLLQQVANGGIGTGDDMDRHDASDAFGRTLYTAASDRAIVDRVGEVAARRGVPRAQVAMAWLVQQPTVTAPIVGARKPEHLEDAVAALDLELSYEETSFLEEPYVPHRPAGFR